jgi:hypothetical protein
LEARFNPPVANDAELYVYTQELINLSLDNWRAKWFFVRQFISLGTISFSTTFRAFSIEIAGEGVEMLRVFIKNENIR